MDFSFLKTTFHFLNNNIDSIVKLKIIIKMSLSQQQKNTISKHNHLQKLLLEDNLMPSSSPR